MKLAAMLLIALFLFGLTHQIAVSEASTSVSGIIGSNTTWTKTNSPYELTGNLLVNSGVTLIIEPGVTVNIGSYYIMVNGTVDATGSAINPIVFNGGKVTFTSSSTSWNEKDRTGCKIEKAILQSTILDASTTVKLENDTINADVTVSGATVISNCKITGRVSGGILSGNLIIGDVSAQKIVNNTITGNVGSGIVLNNTVNGMVTASGDCQISNNTISNKETAISVPSLFFAGGGHPIIEYNIIRDSNIGISIDVFVRDWVGTTVPTIQNNLVYGNGVGIRLGVSRQEQYPISSTLIQNNTITQNGIGVQINAAADYVLINNNIQGNANYSLYIMGSSDVNATCNWWGTANTQIINQSVYDFKNDFNLGRAIFVPFLEKENPSAMPIIPEAFSPAVLSLLMIATLFASLVHFNKRKERKQ